MFAHDYVRKAILRARVAAGGCLSACSSWHVLRSAGLGPLRPALSPALLGASAYERMQRSSRDGGIVVRSLLHFSDRLTMPTLVSVILVAIRDRISAPAQPRIWTPEDSPDLGPRTAVDQALHRLVASRSLRRITHGFYGSPQHNWLTGKLTYPNRAT